MIMEITLIVIAVELLALIVVTIVYLTAMKDEISLHIDSLDIRLRTIIDFVIEKMKKIEKQR